MQGHNLVKNNSRVMVLGVAHFVVVKSIISIKYISTKELKIIIIITFTNKCIKHSISVKHRKGDKDAYEIVKQ